MTNQSMPPLQSQFFDQCGKPLVGGRVFIYEAGTLAEKATYLDKDGTIQNTHPIILNEAGCAAIFYSGLAHVIVVSRCGVLINDVDNVGWVVYSGTEPTPPSTKPEIALAALLNQQQIIGNTAAQAEVTAAIDDSLVARIRADGLEIKGKTTPNAIITVEY